MAAITMAAVTVAAGAYAANRQASAQKKMAKEAAKPKTVTSTRTPYMDETIRAMSPYVLQESLKNYGYINSKLGGTPGNFDDLTAMLQGMRERAVQANTPQSQPPSAEGVVGGAVGNHYDRFDQDRSAY